MTSDAPQNTPPFALLRRLLAILAMAVAGLLGTPAHAQFDFGIGGGSQAAPMFNDSRDEVTAGLLLTRTEANPGADLVAAVILDMNAGWHVWTGVGTPAEGLAEFDGAIRTEITTPAADATAPVQLHPGFATWPEIHGVEADLGDGPTRYAVYEGRVAILVPGAASAATVTGTRTATRPS